jgi:hypothetical protein
MTIESESSSSKDLLNEIINAQRDSTLPEASASQSDIHYTEYKTSGSTAAKRFLEREPTEEGEVLPQEEMDIPEKKSKPRKTNNLKGDEIVSVSSEQPLEVTPLLEKTPKELSLHRDDTHTRAAHQVADPMAKGGGWLDGLLEGTGHLITELTETGTFISAKFIFGIKYGWERGKASGTHNGNNPQK